YTLWVPPSARREYFDERDDRSAHRRGLRSSDSPVTVQSVTGESLDVRVPRTEPFSSVEEIVTIAELGVGAQAENLDEVFDRTSGHYRFRGLPDGEWTVHVTQFGYVGKEGAERIEEFGGSAKASPGSSIEIPVTRVAERTTGNR